MGERVLLIEDDSRLADMVGEYLGKAGFHVVHAENGTRGLALHGRQSICLRGRCSGNCLLEDES